MAQTPFVTWEVKFNVNIPSIDEQHRQLIDFTNRLYKACTAATKQELAREFAATVKDAVDYVRYHFGDEEGLMSSSAYPGQREHKAAHEEFIIRVVSAVQDFNSGKNFVPNTFVRFLRDWLLQHIAVQDKEFARYYLDTTRG